MILEINDEDIAMLKDELGYVRCLYWDNKLERDENYCDGDCHNCEKPYLLENWLKDKSISSSKE